MSDSFWPHGLYAAKSLQSCLTLCDTLDGSPWGSTVPGILQARTLECVAIFFSNAWKWKMKVKSLSRVWLFTTPWTAAHQAPPSMGFSRQEYWSGLKGILLSRKKEWDNGICSNTDGPGDDHTEWRKSETNIIWHHLYVESEIDTNELIYKTEIDSQTQKKTHIAIKGEKVGRDKSAIWN